ncbi:integrase, catalytic region, zinc finger, CCHC-type containing protein [Tanacetum coccineum]
MSQPANDEFSQHLSDDEESNHEDASGPRVAPKQQQQVIPQTTAISNIKLPILKKEEYDIWAMEMEHYLEYIDNDVWKVIQNGNSKKIISTGKDCIVRILSPEHMRRFHGTDDVKEIWEAIRTRFGGNANSKKMQKALLSQLEAHGAEVSTEDANHKFLRSLPPAWSNLAMTMRTNPEIDTLSIDDLYNNLRVFEQEIQGASKTSSSAQNVAFVSQSKSSTNKVKSGFTGAYSTCTPSTSSTNIPEKEVLAGFADEVIYSLFAKQSEDWDLLHEDLEQIDDVDIEEMDINWQIAMIAIQMKKFYKKTGRRVRVDGKTPVSFDKKKLECFNCHNTGHFARECTASQKFNIHPIFYQKEVNEIRVERIAKNANPLALVVAAQQYTDPYYQAPKSHKSYAPPSKQSSSTRSNATTKYKGKEIAKPITPPYELASEEDNDPEQAQRDKDMQKNLALIAKYFKKIYKPTNNNPKTSLNSKNKNVIFLQGTRMKIRLETKRVKDYTYHKEQMLLRKQAEKGVPLQAEQVDWLEDTNEEIDEQELEVHYNYMEKIQEVPTANSGTDTEPLKKVQYDVEYNVFANERQHSEKPESIKCDDERVALANLIANLTLDTEENKKILKQLKKSNASLTQEIKECKSNLEESNTTRDSCLIALQSKQTELETYKTLNDRIVDYDKLERLVKEKTKVITDLKLKEEKDIDKMISMEKQLKFLNEIVYIRNQSIQTIHMLALKGSTFNGRPIFSNPMYLKKAQSEKPCLYEIPYDTSDLASRFTPNREETLTLEKESRSKLNKDLVKPYDYTK